MKYQIKIVLLLLAFLCTACGKKPAAPERVYPVTLGDVTERDVTVFVEAIGNVYSLQTVQVRPQVGGIVEKAYVKQGSYVKSGDPLYKIDPRPYQAALDNAKAVLEKDLATLKYSEIQVQRNTQLASQDFISKLTYEQYQSQVEFNKGQVESDKANVAIAELNLGWTTPLSPIDGKISQYNLDPGNLVVANDTVFLTDIRQITPADIRFNINQADYLRVQNAMQKGNLKFFVLLPQEKTSPREGEIYFVDNHLDTATGTILVKGTVSNEDEKFWPGEFVRVRLELWTLPKAVVVSDEAVKIGQEGAYVYVYHPDTSTVEYRKVDKGYSSEGTVVINKGLKVGEKVIIKGQNNLLPGSKVSIPSQENQQAGK